MLNFGNLSFSLSICLPGYVKVYAYTYKNDSILFVDIQLNPYLFSTDETSPLCPSMTLQFYCFEPSVTFYMLYVTCYPRFSGVCVRERSCSCVCVSLIVRYQASVILDYWSVRIEPSTHILKYGSSLPSYGTELVWLTKDTIEVGFHLNFEHFFYTNRR